MIQCISREKPKQWDLVLFEAEFAYNSSVNKSTGKSPIAIVYYVPPKYALDLVPLPELPGVSQATKNMADHIHSGNARGSETELEATNAKYKEAADKKEMQEDF